jgi:multiple sugar transport system substrate-binding protein
MQNFIQIALKAAHPVAMFVRGFFRIAIILILVLPAIWVLARGPRGSQSIPPNKVVVDYWEKWTGVEGQAIQEIVDDFNRTVGEQKGIYVRLVTTSGVEQKTLVATAAGVPPDIAGLYDSNVAQYAARNALMPLEDLAAANGTINAGTYKKVFWDICNYDGHLYALISSGYDYALYMNTRLMKQAGLDPAKPPQTIDQLDAYAKKMEVMDRSGRINIAGYLPFEPGWTLNQTAMWFGGSYWDAQHQRFQFTSTPMIEAFNWVQSFPRRLGVNAVATYCSGVGNYDSPQNAFMAQTIAMETQGTFFANIIQTHAAQLSGQWEVAAMPSAVPGLKDVTDCGSDVFVIPRGAKHPKEAFEFMAYVTRQDVMEKLSNMHCKISPLAKVSEGFLSHHNNPYIRVFDRLADSPNAHECPQVPISAEVTDEMTNFVDRLRLLQVTPEQGLAQVQETLQAKLDDFNDEQRQRAEHSD